MVDGLLVATGLALLFLGGEGLILGTVTIAKKFRLSPLLVSAVVVGFGTSMPEMAVSIDAAMKGSSGIALGNVIGSNIANVLLTVGGAALLCPIIVQKEAVRRDVLIMLFSTILLALLVWTNTVGRVAGAVMLIGLISYIAYSFVQDKKNHAPCPKTIDEELANKLKLNIWLASTYTIGGLLLLVYGATLLVEGATNIARLFGLPEAVIGLTVVAIGTSLPELATSVVAAYRKKVDLIIGNILGSNVFNILFTLGLTALISPISLTSEVAINAVWVMVLSSVGLSILLMREIKISRILGFVMLFAYLTYSIQLYVVSG